MSAFVHLALEGYGYGMHSNLLTKADTRPMQEIFMKDVPAEDILKPEYVNELYKRY